MNGSGGGGGAKKAMTGAMQFIKGLGHSASNMVHRRSDDEEEDPEYLKASTGGSRTQHGAAGRRLLASGAQWALGA